MSLTAVRPLRPSGLRHGAERRGGSPLLPAERTPPLPLLPPEAHGAGLPLSGGRRGLLLTLKRADGAPWWLRGGTAQAWPRSVCNSCCKGLINATHPIYGLMRVFAGMLMKFPLCLRRFSHNNEGCNRQGSIALDPLHMDFVWPCCFFITVNINWIGCINIWFSTHFRNNVPLSRSIRFNPETIWFCSLTSFAIGK